MDVDWVSGIQKWPRSSDRAREQVIAAMDRDCTDCADPYRLRMPMVKDAQRRWWCPSCGGGRG